MDNGELRITLSAKTETLLNVIWKVDCNVMRKVGFYVDIDNACLQLQALSSIVSHPYRTAPQGCFKERSNKVPAVGPGYTAGPLE